MSKTRLSKEDWLAAGFRALATRGPSGVQINILCSALGTTKGSFYWHFKDLNAYKKAMLELWITKGALEIIDELQKLDTARARLDALLVAAARPAPEGFGGRRIEPAIRAWALSDDMVAGYLERIDAARLGFVADTLTEAGLTRPGLAELIYGAYIGLDDLAARGREDMGDAFAALSGLLEAISLEG